MIIIEILLLIALAAVGVIASITDIREGRIYNKLLLKFLAVAFVLDAIYYGYFARDLFCLFILNFGIIALISLVLFYTHSFAGGDCKLVLVMSMLYPANYYLVYGKSEVTLFLVICIAILFGYLYLLGYSIYELVRGRTKITGKYIKNYIISFLKTFISASGYICLINVMFIFVGRYGFQVNEWIIRIVCMIMAWLIGKKDILKKWQLVAGIYMLDMVSGFVLGFIPFSFNPENYILVVLLLLCQMTIRTCIYQEVPILELKRGMILSSVFSMLMQNSRVRGLPPISSEDLRSRLTEEQVASIGRWSSSRNVVSVTVVRKIPFAAFIMGGFITYFIIWSFVK